MAFDPDAFLDGLGVPQAPSFDPDGLLDSIGVPALQKRKKPATLAALDDEGPNASPPMDRPGDPDYSPPRLHLRDMSQLGAGLRAAGAPSAITPEPEHAPLSDLLGLDVMGDTLAGAGRSAVNTVKAIPGSLNRGTSGVESSLGGLARATGQLLQARPPGASDAGLLGLGPALRAPGRFVERLGGEVEDIGGRQSEQADVALKGNPEADSIISRAVQGIPMLTGMAATGGGTLGATAGMGLLGAGGGLKQAEEAGATPGQAWAAAGLQGGSDALLGQLGSVPLVGKLLHGVPVESAGEAALALLKQAGMGATQAVGMDVAHGLARRATYAPDLGLSGGEMLKNAASQALLQGALEAPGIALPRLGSSELPTAKPPAELFHGAKTPLSIDSTYIPAAYDSGAGGGALFGHGLYTTDSPAVAGSYGPEVSRVAPDPGHQLLDVDQPFTDTLWRAFAGAKKSRWGDLSPQDQHFLGALTDKGQDAYPSLKAFYDGRGLLGPRQYGDPATITDAIQGKLASFGYTGTTRLGEELGEDGTPHREVLLFRPRPEEVRGRVAGQSGDIGPEAPPGSSPPTTPLPGGSGPGTPPPPSSGPTASPFRGTWPEFLASRDMDRSDFAVQTAAGKRALRAEYDAALDAHRDQAAAARAAATPPRIGILDQPEPVHPAIEAAVDHAIGSPQITTDILGSPEIAIATPPASTFPSEVFGRLVEGKPLRLAKSDLERDVGQAAKGLWPTGLLKGPGDVQLLHDTLAGGGDLDAAVTALARQAPQKAERVAPAGSGADSTSAGNSGSAVTDAGTELPFRYGLVNAPDLVTSHLRLGDGSLAPNPDFPAELQPRDRSRAASRLQVDRMANSLDPERLAESRLASQGAPLVGPDGAVESGNARSLAIGAAYQGGPQAAGYRLWLEQNAGRFGLDPAHVRSLDQPVLVRQRLDVPGLDRVKLAQEANQSDVATMSRPERAAADARALTPDLLSQYTPNGAGALGAAGNRGFALGFLQRTTSPAELGALVDARGQLSQEGQARLHAALLAGAYQDPGLVSRMSEATDDNTRSLSRALATEAPAFIGLRQGAASGSVHPGLDLAPDIAAAANKLSELRSSGQRVPEYLAQGGLFGHELTPESQRLLTLFDEFKRTPSRIAETLHRYVELATATGDSRQASLTPQEAPSKADLLERASSTWNQAGGLLPFEEPSANHHAEPAAVVADHLAATLPPEHVASFAPGDSGAVESPTNATALRDTPAVAHDAAGVEGTRRWLLGSALGDQELAQRVSSSADRRLAGLADPLASVAPSLADAPPELRGYLRQAVAAYAATREEGGGASESFYRGTRTPGQSSSSGITYATPDSSYAARWGDVGTVKWNGEGRVLDLRDLGAIADWQELADAVETRGGRGLYDVIQPNPGTYEGRGNVSDVYSMLRQKGAREALEKAGVGLVKVMQLAEGGEREVAAILPKGLGEPKGSEVSRLGRLLGSDAPEEVHHIASFLSENADHPESVALYLHRVAELHQQSGGATGGEGQLSLSQLLEMASDRDQRQAAGSVIPLESSVPISKGIIYSPGEAGFIDFRGPRFGEAAPIRRWFTREGKFAAMGADFASQTKAWVNEKDFRVRGTEKKVLANVRDYGTALRDQMDILKHADVAPPGSPIGPGSTIEEVHQYVRAGIMGENDLSAVSPALQDAAGALRNHLTDQSRAYLQRPDLPATLKAVIAENLDSYFPRTFERITDPKGYAKGIKRDYEAAQKAGVPRGQSWKISEAADWAQREHPDWSREDAEGYAFKLLMDDPQAAYAVARGSAAQKGGMGTESRGNLKARLNLPQELDNLLGLHRDPTRSYQIAAMRAARDLATYDLHSKVARMGSVDPARPDGLTPDGQRPIFVDRPSPDLPVRIGGKGPLAEKYTSEQVAGAIRAMSTISHQHTGFHRLYLLANGAIKTGKIVLNTPMGPARNMLTWPSLLLAGGHWVNAFPVKYAYESMKALPLAIEANLGAREGAVLKFAKTLAYSIPLANGETVGDHLFPTGQKLAELRAEVQRKTERGVLGQSTAADDLRYYTGARDEPTAGQRFQKVLRDTGGIWSGEHDMGKDIVHTSEVAELRWANPDLSPDEIDRWAAERMMATTPSRSEVSEGVKALRANPLTSPFPTFAAERFRNMKNNATIAWEDLNSTNPRMKVLGASRAAGSLMALALAGGGSAKMLQLLWDTTEEHADALREFLPDHFKDHQIAVSDRQGGKIRYADISPLMPATGVTDPAMAFLRGIHQGSTRDGMIDAAQEFARPFLDEEFALKTGVDLLANQQRDGNLFDSATDLARKNPRDIQRRQIYLPGGPPGVVAGQVGKYLWHQDGPGIGLEAERFARANDLLSNTNARGKRYTNQDEFSALGGVRFNTIDMNSALTGVGYQLKDALSESKRYFTGERSSSQNDPKTVLDARAAANDRWKNAFEIGMKKVEAARHAGIADYAIRQNLHISGVPPLVIGQLMAGRYSALPLRMPYRVPQDYVGAGAAPAGDE